MSFRLSPTKTANIIIHDKTRGGLGLSTTSGTYKNIADLRKQLQYHFVGTVPHKITVRVEQGEKWTSFAMIVGDRKKRTKPPKKQPDGLVLKPTKRQLGLLKGYIEYRKSNKRLANWNPTTVLFNALEEMVDRMAPKSQDFIKQYIS